MGQCRNEEVLYLFLFDLIYFFFFCYIVLLFLYVILYMYVSLSNRTQNIIRTMRYVLTCIMHGECQYDMLMRSASQVNSVSNYSSHRFSAAIINSITDMSHQVSSPSAVSTACLIYSFLSFPSFLHSVPSFFLFFDCFFLLNCFLLPSHSHAKSVCVLEADDSDSPYHSCLFASVLLYYLT